MDKTQQEARGVLILSMGVAAFLAGVKIVAALVTHSMAVLALSLDSMMDAGISAVNLIVVKEAGKPPDENHAYGHEKLESIASLFQSFLISVIGILIVMESCRRFVTGSVIVELPLGIGVMILTLAVNSALVMRLKAVNRKNARLILEAEGLHYSMDIWTHGAAILALALVWMTGLVFWDLLLSVAVSVLIFKSSGGILRRSVDELLDRSLTAASIRDIKSIIRNHHPRVHDIHNFRSRKAGEKIFLDFHLEISGENDFRATHDISESVANEILARYPGADVTVHVDPVGEEGRKP